METRILLTGGTGFFGRALLRYFLASGMSHETNICVLTRDPQRFQSAHPHLASSKQISFLQVDILNRESLPWDQNFTHVLHAATDSTIGPLLTPLDRFHQILAGTLNILDLAVSCGARRFLLTSSGGIYGPQPVDLEAIPEDWLGSPPLDDPLTAYSQAKRAAEHLCNLYRDHHKLEVTIARCFAFVGQDMPLDAHFAIGNFIRDAIYGEHITVSGDGTALRTYLDQRDLAHWLWMLLLHGNDGETYNVGSDRVISIADLASLVRDLLSPSKSVKILGEAPCQPNRNRYVPNISKIQRLHGLTVSVTLPQSILETATAHVRP